MKKILLALALFLGLGSNLYAAGASSPITGFSWDNVRKVVRFMTSDGNEITVDQTPKQYAMTLSTGCTGTTSTATVCGLSSVNRFWAMPYRTSDGSWHVRMAGRVNMSSSTSGDFTMSGVTFTTAGACSVMDTQVSPANAAVSRPQEATNIFAVRFASATIGFGIFCDAEVTGKPAWAD